MLERVKRWSVLLVIVVVVLAVRAYGRPPAPESIRTTAKPTPEAPLARGRLVYERYGCMLCHGVEGKGGVANPNALRNAQVPSITEVADVYTVAEVTTLVRNGRSHVDRADEKGAAPPYRMPGWGERMSDQEVSDLVQYVMSLTPKSAKKSGWGK